MSESSPATNLTAVEYYEIIRRRIEHEDNLIVQRLSWLVGSQSFLYTAYAIVLNGLATPPASTAARFISQQRILYKLLPLVAIVTCLLISIGIIAAVRAMAELRCDYQTKFRNSATSLPPIQVRGEIRRVGLAAPVLLPMIFIAVWLFLWISG